ncbi:hypothetical protein [Miltoncostaea oceani]|uniref:hypothetical protein n=1 Tax=Miltoncostaea oceani TaxID=2843216 RepID=UPI001C3D7463|nr:hypothetical protein [Miltoncostaea oceani]
MSILERPGAPRRRPWPRADAELSRWRDPVSLASWVGLASIPVLSVAAIADRAVWWWPLGLVGFYVVSALVVRDRFAPLAMTAVGALSISLVQGWDFSTVTLGGVCALGLWVMWRALLSPMPKPASHRGSEAERAWLSHEVRRLRVEIELDEGDDPQVSADLARDLLERRAHLAALEGEA